MDLNKDSAIHKDINVISFVDFNRNPYYLRCIVIIICINIIKSNYDTEYRMFSSFQL